VIRQPQEDPLGEVFEDIIEKYAYRLSGTEKYLTATWAESGRGAQNFGAAATNFIETSWTLDGHVYEGVSGSEGFDIFGTGEEVTFKFLVGMSFSHEASTTTETEKGWGIGLSDDFGPDSNPQQQPTAAKSYTFRIYFLPAPPGDDPQGLPPNYWVQELKNLAKNAPPQQLDPHRIDGNACAWKIVFVVTDYVLNNGHEYHYSTRRGGP
jgi:hypothetical protein